MAIERLELNASFTEEQIKVAELLMDSLPILLHSVVQVCNWNEVKTPWS